MRKIFILFLLFTFVGIASAQAQKIAILSTVQVFSGCEAGKAAQEKLDKKAEKRTSELEAMKVEIEKMREEMERKSFVLTQEAKRDKEVTYRRKVRDFQDTQQDFQRWYMAEKEKVGAPILKVISEVIKKHGEKNGYDLILPKDPRVMLYFNDKLDITETVIKEVNTAWNKQKK